MLIGPHRYATPSSEALAAGPALDLEAWRRQLLDRLLVVAVLAGALAAISSTLAFAQHGDWRHVAVGWLAVGLSAVLRWRTGIPHAWRSGGVIALALAVGIWLLLRGAALSMVYFTGASVIGVLLLGTAPAVRVTLLSAALLAGLGWWYRVPIGMVGLVDHHSPVRWLVLAGNQLMFGLVLTFSCDFLLRHLHAALAAQQRTADSLRASEESLRQIAEQVPGVVFRLQVSHKAKSRFVYASPGSQALFNLSPRALMADASALTQLLHPEDRAQLPDVFWRDGTLGQTDSQEFRIRLPGSADERWIQVQSQIVARTSDGLEHSGIMLDITERKATEAQVWHQAHVDGLTGLPNRLWLHEQLERAIERARTQDRHVALLLLDLDHFKEVNDTLGHGNGDELLAQAALRLKAHLRASDIVGRMGGDEFALVLQTDATPAEISGTAARLLAVLEEPFTIANETVHVSASIGAALFPDDAGNVNDLLKQADQALYRAKDDGRSRLCRFTPEMQQRIDQRIRLANDLRGALARNELYLVFQPIIDLRTGQVRKAEALLRWRHPERGEVSPGVFIPVAESTGLINEIGEWVFETAARQVASWQRELHPSFQISVNRSPLQFRAEASTGHGPCWGERLAALGLPAQSIAVEITEGLLLDPGSAVADQLRALRKAGLPISLDDFGTGYSALAYLQRFDIDFLKIDRSFVSGMNQGGTGRALCQAIILMAHELGMKVVAEGVETAEQGDWLQAASCDFAQGYHFARPMPADAFAQWMAGRGAAIATPAGPSTSGQAMPLLTVVTS